MARKHAQRDWQVPEGANGAPQSWDDVRTVLLMDIRDELRALNATLSCYRVARMSDDVNRIERRLKQHMPLPRGRAKA